MLQVQTRRAEAPANFRTATPLHEQQKRHPAKRRVSISMPSDSVHLITILALPLERHQ
jgi:hypothetical protein